MTLIVEDGTGLDDANAYISVEDVDTYFSDIGNTAWAGSSTIKEAAIIKATKYIDATYNWNGTIANEDQALGWPRIGAYDRQGRYLGDKVPAGVKDAVAELALYSLSGSLISNTSSSNYVKREKVGEIEVEYRDDAPTDTEYNYVNRLLNGLYGQTGSSGINISLARV